MRTFKLRTFRLWAAATAVATAVTIGTATNASAAACHIVCDGVDPNTAVYEDSSGVLRKCDAATVLTTRPAPVYVEMRYSKKCRMVWARGNVGFSLTVIGYEPNGQERVRYRTGSSGCCGNHWTPAVNDANQTAVVCGGDGGETWCTSRY
jgi:hypothetical protein